VGSVVASELLAQKKQVKVILRDPKKGAEWSQRGAEVATGSLDDQAFLTGALRGATAFFTLLAPPALNTVTDFYGVQRKMADAIAGAVKAANVPHVVLLSSVGADLAEGTGPIKGLHYAEEALKKAGTKLTAIRAGYFQENVGNWLPAARQAGIAPSMGPADFAYPMIATRDIGLLAAKEILATPSKSETVDLHGPPYSMKQVAEKVGKALGKPVNPVEVPQEGWVPAMLQVGMSQGAAESFAEMYRAVAAGKVVPKGDRTVHGKIEIDETIKQLVK
jgi:uncharacterized protein YbjT (DUF2867 family)